MGIEFVVSMLIMPMFIMLVACFMLVCITVIVMPVSSCLCSS